MVDPPDVGSGDTAFDSRVPDVWGCSSAGRASVRQTEGQRFDTAQLHSDDARRRTGGVGVATARPGGVGGRVHRVRALRGHHRVSRVGIPALPSWRNRQRTGVKSPRTPFKSGGGHHATSGYRSRAKGRRSRRNAHLALNEEITGSSPVRPTHRTHEARTRGTRPTGRAPAFQADADGVRVPGTARGAGTGAADAAINRATWWLPRRPGSAGVITGVARKVTAPGTRTHPMGAQPTAGCPALTRVMDGFESPAPSSSGAAVAQRQRRPAQTRSRCGFDSRPRYARRGSSSGRALVKRIQRVRVASPAQLPCRRSTTGRARDS